MAYNALRDVISGDFAPEVDIGPLSEVGEDAASGILTSP